MMNSDMMEEVLGNPEKMEQARQAILENPTLKQAMTQLPGFADMVSESTPHTRRKACCFKEGRVCSARITYPSVGPLVGNINFSVV